jgi:CRP-like cAMP-binding protein
MQAFCAHSTGDPDQLADPFTSFPAGTLMLIEQIIRHLECHTPLGTEEKEALRAAAISPKHFPSQHDVFRAGEQVTGAHIVLVGMACRYQLWNGERQILGCLVPGDIFGLRASMLGRADCAIGSLSPLQTAFLPRLTLLELTSRHPLLLRAVWITTLVEERTSHEWLLNVGRRSALERTAHLLCELFARLRSVGLAMGNSCELPLRQQDLADAVALTAVHLNRVLMTMRRQNLISLKRHCLSILDLPALQSVAGFDPYYLHPAQPERAPAPAPMRPEPARSPVSPSPLV